MEYMNDIKGFSDFIAAKAFEEAECFPIDRYFLKPYVSKILSFDKRDFILYNLERVNDGYTVQLMLCLPELWQSITVDDILDIIKRFTNIFSYYTIINFTYRYVEIDILDLIMKSESVSLIIKRDILDYLFKSQYPNLIKTENDYLFFDEGIYGVKSQDWILIKEKLLLDTRIKPAIKDIKLLRKYIGQLYEMYR